MATNKDKIRAAAQKHLQKGNIDKAIKEYQRLVEEDPKDVRTLLKIGDLQTRKRDYDSATDTYSQVAEFYSSQGFFLKAVAVYKQILKLAPTLVNVNLKLAELYHQLGLVSDATNQYRQISQIYEKTDKLDDSLEILRKMVELDPENVASRIKLAELYAKQGMLEEARVDFHRAAAFLKSQHRVDDFVKVAERLIHFDPTDLDTTRELADIYVKKGDARRALAKLQVCFRADPKDVATLSLLAEAFRDLGQQPKTVSVYRELIRIHREAKNAEAAVKVARRLAEVAPEDSHAQALLEASPEQEPVQEPAFPGVKPAAAIGAITPGQRSIRPPADIKEVSRHQAHEDVTQDQAVPAEAAPTTDEEAARIETINKLLVETDIYVKYGLKAKALAHIAKLLEIEPENREAHEKKKTLLLDEGNPAAIAGELWLMANQARAAGRNDLAVQDLEELLGHAPDHAKARTLLGAIGEGHGVSEAEVGVSEAEVGVSEAEVEVSEAEVEVSEAEVEVSEAEVEVSEAEVEVSTTDVPEVEIDLDEVEEPPASVVAGEGKTPEITARPSELAGVRAADMSATTTMSEAGASEARWGAPVEVEVDQELEVEVEVELEADPASPRAELQVDADAPDIRSTVKENEADLAIHEASFGPDDEGPAEPRAPEIIRPADFQPAALGQPEPLMPGASPPTDHLGRDIPASFQGPTSEPAKPSAFAAQLAGAAEAKLPAKARPASSLPDLGDIDALVSSAVPSRTSISTKPPVAPTPGEVPPPPTTPKPVAPAAVSPPAPEAAPAEVPPPAPEATPADVSPPAPEALPADVLPPPPEARPADVSPPAPESVAPEPRPPTIADISDEIEEVSFFIEQGLEDEARESLSRLRSEHPGHPELLALQEKLAPAEEAEPEALVSIETEPEPEFAEDIDLSAELGAELDEAASDDDFQVAFSDVFDEFKKGVAEQVEEGDFETHYNLGIAYREMGLLDDAIREFELARESPEKVISALTMIGLCQLQQGKSTEALSHFMEGLNSQNVTPSEAVALRYEIGIAFESMGRFGDAARFFEKAHSMDPRFRDIEKRLAEARARAEAPSGEGGHELDELLEETPAERSAAGGSKISYV